MTSDAPNNDQNRESTEVRIPVADGGYLAVSEDRSPLDERDEFAERCALSGHPYHSDDGPHSGRCYCGARSYQAGGL